jgi:hypothetical protein
MDLQTITQEQHSNIIDSVSELEKKDLSFPKFIENKEEEERQETERRIRHQRLVAKVRREQRAKEKKDAEEERLRIWERDKRRRLELAWSNRNWEKNWKKYNKRDKYYFKQLEKERISALQSTPLYKYTDMVCKAMIQDDTVVKLILDDWQDKRGHDTIKVDFIIDNHYYTAIMLYNSGRKYYNHTLTLRVKDDIHGDIVVFNEVITKTEGYLKRKRLAMAYEQFNKED